MARSVMLCVEGVMSEDDTTALGMTPLHEGLYLFQGLSQVFQVILSSVSSDEDALVRWLTYGMGVRKNDWARLLSADNPDENEDHIRRRHFTFLRSTGSDLAYVVTADPAFARFVLRAGVTPLLCPHPTYSRSSFLPDAGSGRVAWDFIEREVQAGRLMRNRDVRLEDADQAEDPGEELL